MLVLGYVWEFSDKLNIGVWVCLLVGLENVYFINNGLIFFFFEGSGSIGELGYNVEGNIYVMGVGIYCF